MTAQTRITRHTAEAVYLACMMWRFRHGRGVSFSNRIANANSMLKRSIAHGKAPNASLRRLQGAMTMRPLDRLSEVGTRLCSLVCSQALLFKQAENSSMATNQPVRLAVVVSHPIQHYVHLYRALAQQEGLIFKAIFCSRLGIEAYHDVEMNTEITWAGNLLEGYDHEFLPDGYSIKGTSFRQVNNPSVTKALDTFKPDVVLQNGYSQLTQLRALAWCRRRGVPSLMISDAENFRPRSGLKASLRKVLLHGLLPQYSGFLTISDRNHGFYSDFSIPESRLFRSAFPIDEIAYREAYEHRQRYAQDIRSRHGISASAFIFLIVGKLSPRKRTHDAIAAVARLSACATLPCSPHLLICGEGAERDNIAAQIAALAAPVTMAGFVNIDTLPHYFGASNVLVHAADYENFGLVCAEAAAAGLPMILSDRIGAIGPTSVARPGQNALLYPCGDIEALTASMMQVITDTGRTNRMAAMSLTAFADNNVACSVAGIRHAIEGVLQRSRAKPTPLAATRNSI
jgi:glycosyltransferase involved in cell wall biosynthesis